MSDEGLFPAFISRDKEQRRILAEAAKVRGDHKSRVVLLYGRGGVGKTTLVRSLAQTSASDPQTIWIDPVDIDDSNYWLLSNLEQHVAAQVDPENRYFAPYMEYLSRLPSYTASRIGYETVVSHLGRIKRIFAECYQNFTESSGKTVVIVLDTVEAIRGMYLLVTLTQWVKALPATLFVLSGRPPAGGPEQDRIKTELEDPHQPLPVTTILLGEFSKDAALGYLDMSGVASGLSDDEKEKLVHLTRGHPLWLAFTVDYLKSTGLPEEAARNRLVYIEAGLPYGADMTLVGQSLHEEFKRRLVAPYHGTDFWHEALKRLAVVRESINERAWQQLMADRPLPDGTEDMGAAWAELQRIPWIRLRANRRYLTLHDAVAEELAQRIIPIHDQDKRWCHALWRDAERIYRELSGSLETELREEVARLDSALHPPDARQADSERSLTAEEEERIVTAAAELEPRRRELSQLKAVRLYYELLSDPARGCQQFLKLMERAKEEHDILFQNLLAAEMQRFLPGGAYVYPLGDAVGEGIGAFRSWLKTEQGRALHLDIGLSMADYLIKADQPEPATTLLVSLPEQSASRHQRYRLNNLRGNACMRIPHHVKEGLTYFRQALGEAERLESDDRLRFIAKAHKELGFYYRNAGMWEEADDAYQQARNAISQTLLTGGSADEREEMASIQTNWAYVKGLTGHYRDGTNLAESAITVRSRLKNLQEEGISWSVCGEVYRYERRFQKAWEAYAHAERIFQERRNWSWLGLVYQEQAICLFQAAQEGTELVPEAVERAKRLITVALDLCRDLAVRGYPSALNRAGRIYGTENPEVGLSYLEEGIETARSLLDGWFWFANVIEFAELCYRAWVQSGEDAYRDRIRDRMADIGQLMDDYEFPDLKGRWDLLQGHFAIHRALSGDESSLDSALEHYTRGFALIAQGYVGSSGASAVAAEFSTFSELVWRLPDATRQEWQAKLRRAWGEQASGSTLLLARLEELY